MREATPRDAEAISTVHRASWLHANRALLVPNTRPADRRQLLRAWGERLSTELSEDERVYVMLGKPGDLCGFIWVGPTIDPDDDAQTIGQVRSIHLLPKARGAGRGRMLLKAGISHLVAAGRLASTLWVLESNHPAIGFYEHEGWRPDGARRFQAVALTEGCSPPGTALAIRYRLVSKSSAAFK